MKKYQEGNIKIKSLEALFLTIILIFSSSQIFTLTCLAEFITNVKNNQSETKYWSQMKLWYRQPAKRWVEALPVGNGRLGAMVFGKTEEERIQLNEETIWTGGPYDPSRAGGPKALPEIHRLVFQGNYLKAHKLFGRTMMGIPNEQMKYQPLGNLWLTFPGHKQVSEYRRQLDLDKAIVQVTYNINDIRFTREAFSSAVDQVIVIHLSANKPGKVSCRVNLTGYRNTSHSNYGNAFFRMEADPPDSLVLWGRTSNYLGIEGRVKYRVQLKACLDKGEISLKDESLIVKDADAVTFLIAAATNFVSYKDLSGDPEIKVKRYLNHAAKKSYEQIRREHVAEYRQFFRHVCLDLGTSGAASLPTDQRLRRVSENNDPQLAALFFQFGRYLLISSSRPGTQPANLQGIWNEDMNPAWDSKYTTNINLEMNYWPAEVANLSQCHKPLLRMISELVKPGSRVAKLHYGARGWVLHQNTDLWRACAPMDGPSWGTFSTGGAWLCSHLWEHYLYSGDQEFLKNAYPIMKGSAQFFLDTLVEHPKYKWLVTCPATSPENVPKVEKQARFMDESNGLFLNGTTICAGSTIDMEILRYLFDSCIKASEILNVDKRFREEIRQTRQHLAPLQIGKYGQLQEWLDDWDDPQDTHRHLSHLWGLYPGNMITPQKTPDLVQAAKKSLIFRGDGGPGFSMAWKVNLWARLLDGEHAYGVLKRLLTENTYPNLFSKCYKALQVDGTFGGCAGIAEMLLQSHADEIHLLPALPKAWLSGTVKGLRARGGFEVVMEWKKGKLTKATILSKLGKDCRIRVNVPVEVKVNGQIIEVNKPEKNVIVFKTEPNKVYELSIKQ